MQKTANYQLNQWVKSDRILMEDFNSDNQKIDAALKALDGKSAFTLLKTVTVPEGGDACQLDVSDVNWSQWQYVLLDLDLKGTGYVCMRPNNSDDGTWTSDSTSSSNGMVGIIISSSIQRIVFSVAKSATRKIHVSDEYNVHGGNRNISYAELNTLDFAVSKNTYTIGAGGTLTLWGVG